MSLKYLNLTGLSRVITNLKNWVVSQIPTKTSEITNDSGFLTSHQSLDGKMTRGSYERIEGNSSNHKDLNDYITAGFYNVKTAYVDNCPTGIERDAALLVYPWNAGSYCTQEITETAASTHSRRWIRKLNNTTWSDWVAVAFHGDNLSAFNNDSGFITSSSLPTVNNATLTIQKNGTNVQTFTANASSNKTANITVPTKTSELTNDSGYLTAHQTVSNSAPTLAWGATVTIGTIGGTALTVKMPANPNTNTTYSAGTGLSLSGTTFSVTSTTGTSTLAWNSEVTLGTVGGLAIKAKLPANPNTNTKNTAGSTNTSSKIFLIGATSQAANPQTYSHDTAYVGTDGCLYSGGTKVLTAHQSLSNYSTLANTVKSISISGNTITVTPGSGDAYTLTTQDTTYSNFVKSGSGAKAGLVPSPGTTAGTTKYLREDGTWQVPPDHTYTVNNATLTIQKNGSNVATFTSNASSNVTANITVPTKTSELTNDSGFLTNSDFSASYVTLNTQQNISANKFFYGGAWRVGSNYPSFICKNNAHTVGEAAPSSMWGYGEFLIQDKNAYSVCLLSCRYDQNATQYFRIECRNKFTNGAPAVNGTAVSSVLDVGTLADGTRYVYWNSFINNALVPRITYAWNIGDASHAWNIVYATNYKIKGPNTQIGVTTSNSTVDFIDIVDANNTQLGYIGRWQHSNGYSCINLTCYDKYDGAGNRSTSGTVANGTLEIGVSNTGVPYLNYNTYFMQNISPLTNDNNDLGDASHHWRNLFIGEMHCYHQNALMAKSGGYTFLLRNDGSNIWFLISEANGNEGTWSGLRPLYINCATGACTTSSKWTFNKSFGDGDPSVLIQSGTEYANGTWNYPLAALAPNMKAGANLFMPIGRNFAAGNCAGWHFYYAGNNSNDNFLSVEFYAAGSPFAVYRDGRVILSASPAASDNSNRVATTAYVKNQGYLSGTVPIANGGTGATTRLGAVQNLTNEHVGTSTQYFLTITQNWGKAGYCSVADAKTVLGIGTTSKKLTLIGERETAGTWTLTCTTLAPIYFKIIASKTSSSAEFVCGITSSSTCRFVMQANNYDTPQIIYSVVSTSSSGVALWGIGIPTSTSITVEVWARNTEYQKVFNVKAYQ